MEITFIGAAREVTGSCTLLRIGDRNILVDCGLRQGAEVFEETPLPIAPSDVDCVFLTHAHIDHSGKLPKLVADGFRGRIFATEATVKLCNIMLRDSAHIQETEAEWRNRKAKRSGANAYFPLYTTSDAVRTLSLFTACAYEKEYGIFDNVSVKFSDAGHLLGSASILVTATENGTTKKILFSGDVGNVSRPLIRDPSFPTEGDYVVVESTYGDRLHPPRKSYEAQLCEVLQSTFDKGGNVIIPSFAVGRTQEMLYLLREIKKKNLIKNHDFPVWVDSPLAAEATGIYSGGMREFYDDETLADLDKGVDPLRFPGLCLSKTTEESRFLNSDKTPKVIISASGMCEAGRIRHHLKHNLWRAECTVLFVGYQAEGTLGRAITDGAKTVTLFNETVKVNARIEVMDGISGHADSKILLDWLSSLPVPPEKVFVNHGQESSASNFAETVKEKLRFPAVAPYPSATYDLATGECLACGVTEKADRSASAENRSGFSAAFQRLKQAAERLLGIALSKKGRSNRDLERFAKQIDELSSRWKNR